VPALDVAKESGAGGLVVIGQSVAASATALLLANSRAEFPIVAVKPPGFGQDGRRGALEDLAILTGGRALLRGAGGPLRSRRAGELGLARRVWATTRQFGIVCGRGDAAAIRAHVGRLANYRDRATRAEERSRAKERIGAFHGVSSTLWIGGRSQPDVTQRLDA